MQKKILNVENENTTREERNFIGYSTATQSTNTFFQLLMEVLIIIIGVILISKRIILPGDLLATVTLATTIAAPIEVLSYLIFSRKSLLPTYEQYIGYIEDDKCIRPIAQKNLPIENSLTIENISYTKNNNVIIINISLKFEKNKKYLITGESGSGKSTLLNIIDMLYTDYNGDIFLNNNNIRNINDIDYYQIIYKVSQQPYIFYMSLYDNIAMGRDISENKYIDILSKLNLLSLYEKIGKNEFDKDTLEHISGGEKQRIALARALVDDFGIYLFDEVTSSLDEKNSLEIEKLILSLNGIVINVTHKPNAELKELYDCHYALDKGNLVNLVV